MCIFMNFSRFFGGFRGFSKVQVKKDFMKGRKEYIKNRRISSGKKGNKMKVSFEWREGKNGVLQQSFLHGKQQIFRVYNGNSSED